MKVLHLFPEDDRLIAALTRDWWRHNDRNEHYKESPIVY